MEAKNGKHTCEAAVLYSRPWFGEGTKRFVADDEVTVGIALGKFLVQLYKRGGRALELAVQRSDGSHEVVGGREWEKGAGIKREVLS